MKLMTIVLTGDKELLMHNERLANPLDKITQEMKALTGKRKKTDADVIEISEVEFRGGLYFDETVGPYIPDRVIRASLIQAARKMKAGKEVSENVMVLNPMMALEYQGPRTIKGLWRDGFYDRRMVGNQKARVLRTRPKFPLGWSVTAELQFDDAALDQRTLEAVVKRSETLGICDFRPVFGTFKSQIKGVVSLDLRRAA